MCEIFSFMNFIILCFIDMAYVMFQIITNTILEWNLSLFVVHIMDNHGMQSAGIRCPVITLHLILYNERVVLAKIQKDHCISNW